MVAMPQWLAVAIVVRACEPDKGGKPDADEPSLNISRRALAPGSWNLPADLPCVHQPQGAGPRSRAAEQNRGLAPCG